ncbi:MAG: mechanosensitive ion channel [Eubacterium sp.]|nr:mechanosensitive ion channel [Eubacterium sp.]
MEDLMTKGVNFTQVLNNYIEKFSDGALDLLVKILVAVLILFIGFRLIRHIVKLCKTVFQKSKMDPALETFLLSTINIGLKVIIIFVAITEIGVATSSVIALLGSAGLAIGMSLQGSLSNIAGGVILLFMKPFDIGDYIQEHASGFEGFVESIGIMYTRLRTTDNRSIHVPNGKLSSDSIVNISHRDSRQEDIRVGVGYDADIKVVRDALQEVIDNEEAVIRFQPMEVFVNDFKDSCIEMRIRFWVKTDDYWKCRWRTLENIKLKFDEYGIDIPFNQLDLHIKDSSGHRESLIERV